MKLKASTTFAKPIRQQSLAELYKELDRIQWGWKVIASCGNWMMLAGFVVLPSAFDDDDSKFRVNSVALRATAVALLLAGYIITGVLCYYFKNILFQVEAIFVPGFTGSILGMLSALFNIYGKKYDPGEKRWSGTAISAVTLSGLLILFYGTTALTSQRRIDIIRKRDASLDELHGELENPDLIPEEEHTRRQLLRLLINQPQSQTKIVSFGGAPDSDLGTSRRTSGVVRQSVDVGVLTRGEEGRVGSEGGGEGGSEGGSGGGNGGGEGGGNGGGEGGGEGGGLGLPAGLRLDQEFRRSGIIMRATLGHDEEINGDYYYHYYGPW